MKVSTLDKPYDLGFQLTSSLHTGLGKWQQTHLSLVPRKPFPFATSANALMC
jgi:hypothetical protein